MGTEGSLKTWVSDNLMSHLGYSHTADVQYMIRLSKQPASPADVLEKLIEFGFPSSSETRALSEELYSKVPRSSVMSFTGPKLSGMDEEEAVRRNNALEQDAISTSRWTYNLLRRASVRDVSREEYLKRREQKKLEEIRDDIEDEQYIFQNVKLTET